MKTGLKEWLAENIDTIGLLTIAIVGTILVRLDLLGEEIEGGIIILILCLLAVRLVRLTYRTAHMHEGINSLRSNARIVDKMGIMNMLNQRIEIPIEQMHREVRRAREVFILSRYFSTFSSEEGVQTLLQEFLKNGGSVRILIYSPEGGQFDVNIDPDLNKINPDDRRKATRALICGTVQNLRNFEQKLAPDKRKRFQYRFIENYIIYAWILGTPNKIFATFHLNGLKGDVCPTVICEPVDDSRSGLYSKLADEFNRLWRESSELP